MILAQENVPHNTFCPPFCFFSGRQCIHTCSSSLLSFSPQNTYISSVLFLPFSFPNSLSYFRAISSFSIESICTSSTSLKFSASSLAVGPFWVSGSDVTDTSYTVSLFTEYLDLVPELINQWDQRWAAEREVSLCSRNWVVYFEGYENLGIP